MDYEKKYKEMKARVLEMERGYVKDLDYSNPRQIAEYIDPELKESEDERIRKEMIFYFTEEIPQCSIQEHADKMKEFIAFLEKQGEHAKFINNIQIGDQVTKKSGWYAC